METFELKKEQDRLAPKIVLRDSFDKITKIAGTACLPVGNKLLACVVVCDFPSLRLREKKTYFLPDPLPYHPGLTAYREMPAIIEAYNQLEEDPDIIMVKGDGILHPRRLGLASHLGLALNKPTIGVMKNLPLGKVEKGKIICQNEIMGFEITTKEHANPMYVSPGHYVALGTLLDLIPKTIIPPHKMPEPIHLAQRMAKKILEEERERSGSKIEIAACPGCD